MLDQLQAIIEMLACCLNILLKNQLTKTCTTDIASIVNCEIKEVSFLSHHLSENTASDIISTRIFTGIL